MTLIYKLLDAADWDRALKAGAYEGSEADLADGFIHFSTGEQLAETAHRYFEGRDQLVCLSVEAEGLSDLRWEPSRGGALFPHLYSRLETAAVVAVQAVLLDDNGKPKIDPERL